MIDLNSEPVSTIKVTGTTWNPNAGRDRIQAEQAEREAAHKQAQIEAGTDLNLRVMMLEHAVADLQKELKAKTRKAKGDTN